MHRHGDITEFVRLARDEFADRVRIHHTAHLNALRIGEDELLITQKRPHIKAQVLARDRQFTYKHLSDAPLTDHAVDGTDLAEYETRAVDDRKLHILCARALAQPVRHHRCNPIRQRKDAADEAENEEQDDG